MATWCYSARHHPSPARPLCACIRTIFPPLTLRRGVPCMSVPSTSLQPWRGASSSGSAHAACCCNVRPNGCRPKGARTMFPRCTFEDWCALLLLLMMVVVMVMVVTARLDVVYMQASGGCKRPRHNPTACISRRHRRTPRPKHLQVWGGVDICTRVTVGVCCGVKGHEIKRTTLHPLGYVHHNVDFLGRVSLGGGWCV